ncbi:hypothetical protein DC429_06940 [Arthrobacter sp. TPD3018]|uniref:hypothetical protein n=1 Tax=Bacteria TaxID=2 RepID=UPI000D5093C8|nr:MULTISPECIES: hypothetical protein [Bacteria]PVE60082.1 hypothetical protein DC425_06930 [Sphingomonas sp. TPD3009]PVE61596.1 hypothetical protein DC429_06940 [Arthrobacter sp. TPD3018]PVE85485.1 hypothetical protein DC431_06245 [Sphingomonas melonis]
MKTALLALAAMLAAAPAEAQSRCITTREAEAMTLVALPDIIQQTGIVCSTRLPATSLIRQTDSDFLARYQSAADRAWPNARAAIVKLSDPMIDSLLQSEFARPLLTAALAPLLVGRINPADCGTIDRFVTQLAPLPPQNTAGVIVTTLRYFKAEKAKGKAINVPDLPLCPEAR